MTDTTHAALEAENEMLRKTTEERNVAHDHYYRDVSHLSRIDIYRVLALL